MATQLPAILQFVTSSGDSGVIAEMFRASSVTQAANEWGKGVERYGINDVHTEGISLATSFMKNGGLVPTHVFDRGGTLAPGVNTVYNLTGKPEHLTPTNGGAGNVTTLEVVSGGESEFQQFMLMALRKWVRIKGGRGEGSVQRAFGRN
jgi:hypothetical protein